MISIRIARSRASRSNDEAGTEIYALASIAARLFSPPHGNVRLLNYAGSIAHWLYPTELRHHKRVLERI